MNNITPTKAQVEELANKLARERLDSVNSNCLPVEPSDTLYGRYGKRFLDITISLLVLIVTAPINLILALATLLDVGWPIVFKQKRVGKGGKLFTLIKFRNMKNTKDENGELLPADKRVTKFGKIVRKTSLDELLNFWSIFKGDMSLIGPRPLLPEYTDRYSKRHITRLTIRPGLECPPRTQLDHAWTWDEQFENDVWYVENVSFLTDCKMIAYLIRYALNPKNSDSRGSANRRAFIGYDENGKAISLNEIYGTGASEQPLPAPSDNPCEESIEFLAG